MIELSSYALSILREGEFTLYRGYADGLDPILLVAPDSDTSEIASIGRFQHEYALRTALDSRWAARPIALSRYRDRMALVLDDPGGEPLDRLLAQPLDLRHFLRIAIPLAAACRQMHAYGIIHKDIKPSNVLVDTDGGRVRLMGFGIASRSRREHQDAAPPEVIAGTLAYMAPEQTGRMNRSIDSRSDLYALGATFYEMLTGAPPFTAGDPMELMHAHIARQAVPPHQRLATVPELISSIVMKLLAKTMEERYQTAAGVEADLRRCLAEWEAHGRVAPFPLGTHDASDQLQIPEKLYGREREIEMLVAAFDRVVASGMPELVLVSGYPGIGKSSVVNALRKALGPQHVLFAAGKFDQYKRDIPYAILAQAFQDQIRSILGRDDAELARWRDAIGSALGPNGRLIVNLIPELELVIGPQPPPPDLPPLEAQNRFQTVFRRFIAVFARPERPLVLFLDDLQWLDRATLDLMQHIVAHEGVRHLMVVGAYRDNEVSPTHPLISALNEIRGAGTPIHEIVLSPLGLDDVGLLIAEALGCDEERARPLAQLVHDKAGGNPFFTIQFLTELAEEQLLTFDHEAAAWTWDLPRIHQKGYTDNILDLMGGKLNRLPAPSQEALKQFARLGNVADFATLALLQGQSEDALHAALSDVVRSGLLIRTNNAYRFAHDRVHEAAYTLTAEADRAQAHLRIGRRLAENLSPRQIAESVFDIVNQFNAGHELIRDRGEMDRVAELNLQAGQRAKAGTAYASAVRYLSVGMDLLGKEAWVRRYDLAFALWIEAAECEYLNGDFEKTERLISEVLSRARSNVDRAAAYRIMIIFHSARGEYHDAIARGLECLRLFGIVLSARATHADVLAEYQRILGNLGQRSIGDLIDLPLMTHPEMQAVVRILTFLFAPASLLNNNLFYMLICSAANLTLRYGVTEASIHIYSGLAQILGPVFHRYEDGLRFAVLARGTAEKYRFVETKAYFAMECASVWSRPIQTAIDFIRLTFRAAIETSDLSYACYSCIRLVSDLLVQGAHLDEVWSESEKGLAFVRRVKFRAPEDILISQQQMIRQLRGEADESPGSDAAPFNEEDFVARLTAEGHTTLVCWYWILQLQARYISGDFEIARSAADHAAALLWATEAFIYSADYCYYRALTVAALHRPGRLQENSAAVLETLYGHLKQLREWADACPETFVNRYVLVAAEIARLEGRELDAERSYEEAIRSARKHGFVQNEAIANEVAARFHVSRGFETIANTYLRNARSCYLRWGAAAKARRLEQSHPQLREGSSARSATTIGEPIEHLDVATVVKASQAVSGEIVLDKLVETLMTIALEHAGAERGMLVLLRDNKLQIEAEAATGTNSVDVVLRPRPSTSVSLPESLLQTVMRTRERVIIDDARRPNPFAEDVYVLRQRPRSVLCLPLLKQAKLIGLIYLENNLAPATFTPQRIAVLELLASQAAISLENAGLYAELIAENRERRKAEEALRASEASLAEAQRISRTGNWRWNVRTGAVHWSAEHFVIFGVDPAVEQPSYAVYLRCVHPEDVPVLEQTISRAARETSSFKHEYRIVLRDGSIKYVQSTGHPVNTAGDVEFVGTVMDITERRRAEEALRRAQEELARVSRLSTMGELAGSIIHEISQPLAAIVTNAEACLRWLNRDVPDLDEARDAVSDLARAGRRAADVVKSLKTLARKSGIELTKVDLNDAIQEVLAVLRNELERGRVVLNVELFAGDRPVLADRIQLQQVLLNLIRNAIEAMSTVTDRARKLRISWQPTDNGEALVAVEDSGTGLEAAAADRVFEPLFTTKPEGMGMGLSICRSIVDAHRGRLWASLCLPHGTVFRFTVPFADVAH